MRSWGKFSLGCAIVLVLGLFVFLGTQGLTQASLWATVFGLPAALVSAGVSVWPMIRPVRVPVPPELKLPEWVVQRPEELARIVTALLGPGGGAVGITTALRGVGGFGKSTLARMVCADPRVRRQFGGLIYWVTVGHDVVGTAALVKKVNEVIKLVAGAWLDNGGLAVGGTAGLYMFDFLTGKA